MEMMENPSPTSESRLNFWDRERTLWQIGGGDSGKGQRQHAWYSVGHHEDLRQNDHGEVFLVRIGGRLRVATLVSPDPGSSASYKWIGDRATYLGTLLLGTAFPAPAHEVPICLEGIDID